MTTQLESLQRHSVIVADTGDLDAIQRFRPQDATTNPSLILKAAQDPRFTRIVGDAIAGRNPRGSERRNSAAGSVETIVDRLFVGFGLEILTRIPGRVSTEVDARLSFDTPATEAKARHLIDLYAAAGVKPE